MDVVVVVVVVIFLLLLLLSLLLLDIVIINNIFFNLCPVSKKMVIKKLVKMTVLKLLFKVRKMLSVKTEKVSVRPKLNEY